MARPEGTLSFDLFVHLVNECEHNIEVGFVEEDYTVVGVLVDYDRDSRMLEMSSDGVIYWVNPSQVGMVKATEWADG